jgi:cytosine/adenosine deaminase-related metal-dependent hydrolase
MLIRNVRPWGGEPVDLLIEGDRIAAITPHVEGSGVAGGVDGRGRLVLPSFSDVHVHLDFTRIGLPFRPHTASGPEIWALVMNDRQHWRSAEVGLQERVAATLELMIAKGTTRVRSFAQVDVDCKLAKFDAVMAAKEKFARHADVQIITFPQAGILREKGTVELLEESLKQGSDVMGGLDPSEIDRDPVKHLDIVFGLAEKYQVEVDIHLHEPGELGVFTTELILERTRALGMQGKVNLSHAYELGSVSEAVSRRLIEDFAELDVSMTTVAPVAGNTLSLLELSAAGVRVGLGEDGQRDYWTPYGNCDMLDRTWQLAFTNNFRLDEYIEHTLAVATMGGASIMSHDLPRLAGIADRPGVGVGDRADLVIVGGETPATAVMDRGLDRTVVHDGRVVADGLAVLPS